MNPRFCQPQTSLSVPPTGYVHPPRALLLYAYSPMLVQVGRDSVRQSRSIALTCLLLPIEQATRAHDGCIASKLAQNHVHTPLPPPYTPGMPQNRACLAG